MSTAYTPTITIRTQVSYPPAPQHFKVQEFKSQVLMQGTQLQLSPSTSPIALHAIYAAKLAHKIGYWAALKYCDKHSVPARLFSLAYMCETTPYKKEN